MLHNYTMSSVQRAAFSRHSRLFERALTNSSRPSCREGGKGGGLILYSNPSIYLMKRSGLHFDFFLNVTVSNKNGHIVGVINTCV